MLPADRHALLADATRRALLDELRAGGGPLDVPTLAARLGLRRNSVRDQLRRLEAAGMVHATTAAPAGRGRPRHLYEAGPESHDDPYRLLTSVLADELASRPGGEELGAAAGDRWGRAAAATARERDATAGTDPVGTLVSMLDQAGFAPVPVADGGRELRLRACPFMPLEPGQAAIVCGVHRGFIRGALAELGAPATVDLEPFAEPGLCVARLGAPPATR